jgi:hypothetical protein
MIPSLLLLIHSLVRGMYLARRRRRRDVLKAPGTSREGHAPILLYASHD